MPFNGAGTFTLTYDWEQDKLNGIKIRADRMMGQEQDIADGLSDVVTRDGQSPPTANLPMGGFKLTGLGAGSGANDSVRMAQLQNNDATYIDVSGQDTYSANPTPVLTAYATGQAFLGYFSASNTTIGPTVNLSGLGAKNLRAFNNSLLWVGAIPAGSIKLLVLSPQGSVEVLNPTPATVSAGALTDGGLQAGNFTVEPNTKYLVAGTTVQYAFMKPASQGDISMLVLLGSSPLLMYGTVNGASGTIAVDGNQTFWVGYGTAGGWN